VHCIIFAELVYIRRYLISTMYVNDFSFHLSRRLIAYLTRVLFSDGRQRRSSAEEFTAPKTLRNDWLNWLAAGVISTAYSYHSNSPPFCLI